MKILVSGGLGNQMFQYALYLTLKLKGERVILDNSLYDYTKMHNGYELEKCFGLIKPQVRVTNLGILKIRFLLKYKPKFIVYSDKLHYNKHVFDTKCNYLIGYWQSEKYFKHIEVKIREAFNFKNIDPINNKIALEMESTNSIALHIRRGDYINNSNYEGVCTEEYYLKAINLLNEKIDNNKNTIFYIFSDDKEFANQFEGKLNINTRIIEHNKDENSYKDMYLMSKCKHNIIANSSFSWWGAWLNNNPNKIVIAPKRWFGTRIEENYTDIVPESWIKIN